MLEHSNALTPCLFLSIFRTVSVCRERRPRIWGRETETFGHAISRCEIAANAAKTPTPASQKGRVLVNLFGSPNGKPTGVVAKW